MFGPLTRSGGYSFLDGTLQPQPFPTKVQLIKRKDSEQWYINFPSAIAQAMEFQRGEVVEWIIEDKSQLVLRRRSLSASTLKETNHGRD